MSVEAMTWALNQRTGSSGRKLVLLALADRAGFDWTCWPSQETIAKEAEMTERNVRRILVELEEGGLITRTHRQRSDGHRTSDLIRLDPTGQYVRKANRTSETGQPDIHDSSNRKPTSGEPSVEPSENQKNPPTPQGGTRRLDLVDGRFDLFWAEWPKKTDRKAAEKAFKSAMKIADHEDVIAGLQPWLRYWGSRGDDQYIPYPATWLNKERWKDEPPPLNGSKPVMSKGAQALIAYKQRRMSQ